MMRIEAEVEAGRPYTTIARRLGLSYQIVSRSARAAGVNVTDNPRLYAVKRVAEEFFDDINRRRVEDWIRRGWLRVSRSRATPGGRGVRRTTFEHLLRFLENEETWIAWQPEELADPEVRAWATEMREAAGWRWLTAVEVRRLEYVSRATLNRRIRSGYYPTATLYRHRWYVRSDDPALLPEGE
jgi:DNA invertase Pin-like site-specific DNA recombinase